MLCHGGRVHLGDQGEVKVSSLGVQPRHRGAKRAQLRAGRHLQRGTNACECRHHRMLVARDPQPGRDVDLSYELLSDLDLGVISISAGSRSQSCGYTPCHSSRMHAMAINMAMSHPAHGTSLRGEGLTYLRGECL